MAEEQPSLHIDTDWKKQAQEEKRRLAEQEKAKAEPPKPPTSPFAGGAPVAGPSLGAASTAPESAARTRAPLTNKTAPGQRELPPPSFAALVQSVVTQI